MIPLREQLREMLETADITNSEIARRSGISQPNVSDYINGKADVVTDTFDRLVKAVEEATGHTFDGIG